jgi:hypothetical protein
METSSFVFRASMGRETGVGSSFVVKLMAVVDHV